MKKHLVNVNDIAWQSYKHNDFCYQEKRLRIAAGGEKIGATLYQLMPGKKAFPFHFHHANEEAVFVLEGNGSLRTHKGLQKIKSGDYIAFPSGPEFAHQIINTSKKKLVFLCFSTMNYPEIVEYPDSKKVGFSALDTKKNSKTSYAIKAYYRKDDNVDYFEGEG